GNFAGHRPLALVVHRRDRLDEPQRRGVILSRLYERDGVFREARAAEAGPGMQELGADAIVEPDAARDFRHVGTDRLAQVGDLADEGDLHRQKRIGRVFDQLGRAALGVEQRRRVEVERAVEFRHALTCARIVAADDDAVGMFEIADRRALAQELRIRHHRYVGVGTRLADDALDLVAGADGYGRLGDDQREALERGRDLAGRSVNEREVGMAIAAARGRADGDEYRVGSPHRRCQFGREHEAALAQIRFDQFRKAGLEDRYLAARKR